MTNALKTPTLLKYSCIIFSLCASSPAAALLMNTDITNTTGNVVNDYHIKLESDNPIDVQNTFRFGGDVAFDSPTITGNGSTSVSLDFSGATVNNGQDTHIGFYTPTGNVKITESYWTLGGVEVTPRLGKVSANFYGTSTDYLVARVSLYDDILGTNQIGTMWWEDQAQSVDFFNYTSIDVYASFAFARFSQQVALADLNDSLSGFGAESGIQLLRPVPSPATLWLLGVGLVGLTMLKRYDCKKR